MLRIWDCFFLEGSKVIFRFSCALLKMHEKLLLEQCDVISLLKSLKYAAKYTFDVDGLAKVYYLIYMITLTDNN